MELITSHLGNNQKPINDGKPIKIYIDQIFQNDDPDLLSLMEDNPSLYELPSDDQIFRYSIAYDFPKIFMHMFNKMQLYMRPQIYPTLLNQIIHSNMYKTRFKIHFIYQMNIIKLIVERGNISFSVKQPVIYDLIVRKYCDLEIFKFYLDRCPIYNPIEIIMRAYHPDVIQYILYRDKIKPSYLNWDTSQRYLNYNSDNELKLKILLDYGFTFNIPSFLIKCNNLNMIKLVSNRDVTLTSDLYDTIYRHQPLDIFKSIIKLCT